MKIVLAMKLLLLLFTCLMLSCGSQKMPLDEVVDADSVRPVKVIRPRVPPVERGGGMDEHFSPNTLIIMVDPEVGKEALLQAVEGYGAELIYDYDIIPGIAIRKPEGKTLEQTMEYFRQVKGVVRVSRDQKRQLYDTGKSRPGPR